MKTINVLVTGSTAPGFVSIIKALKSSNHYNLNLFASDFRESISSRHYVENLYVLPDNRSEEFAEAMLELCVDLEIDVILPIRTDDQMPLCKEYGAFRKQGIEPAIVVTNPHLMDSILNKRALMEYTRDIIKIHTPEFTKASTSEELESAVHKLGYPKKHVVIKPSYSNGSRGFRVLNENFDSKRMFFEEKPTGIYTTLNRVVEDIGDIFPELIVMEYLPGKEYTLDILCRKGNTFAILPRLRTKMTGGITTGGILSKDSNFEALEMVSKKLVEGFGLSYNVGVQMKEDEEGTPQLLEINPRLQGTTTMSVAGGVNIPELMIMMALSEFDYDYQPEIKWGLEMERVWLEIFKYDGDVWRND
jgi:carbamoyl-phosphate synthase large subunit